MTEIEIQELKLAIQKTEEATKLLFDAMSMVSRVAEVAGKATVELCEIAARIANNDA